MKKNGSSSSEAYTPQKPTRSFEFLLQAVAVPSLSENTSSPIQLQSYWVTAELLSSETDSCGRVEVAFGKAEGGFISSIAHKGRSTRRQFEIPHGHSFQEHRWMFYLVFQQGNVY